jgi:hypothetical protein
MTQIKVCSKCKIEKSLTEFHKATKSKDGYNCYCKFCNKLNSASYRVTNPNKARSAELKRLYGITLNDYLEILEAQNGRCAICGTDVPGGKGAFHVDHCHTSNKVRGLLCHHCNVGIGNFKDNISTLASAILYLSEHQ